MTRQGLARWCFGVFYGGGDNTWTLDEGRDSRVALNRHWRAAYIGSMAGLRLALIRYPIRSAISAILRHPPLSLKAA